LDQWVDEQAGAERDERGAAEIERRLLVGLGLRHFAGKDELLAAMIDRIAGELPIAELGKAPWQEQLKDAIRAIRSGLGAHRGLARASLGTIPTGPNALRWVNGLLGVLRDAGLPRLRRRHPAAVRERHRVRGVAVRGEGHAGPPAPSTSPSCGATSRRCRPSASRTSSRWLCP
jgi:AcrR family transcriptional regulator